MRELINGLLYLLWTGCQWQALPKDLPPKSTVHHYFKLWSQLQNSPVAIGIAAVHDSQR
jgi:transposase